MTDNHDHFYQTGSTTPPKGHGGLVAILLVLVIFLAGLVSILSLLNIKMFSAFYKAQHQQVPLALESGQISLEDSLPEKEEPVAASGNKCIGITGDAITPVYQQHFHLPEGLFITYVEEGSSAQARDIREGDVLLSLDGEAITGEESLKDFLNKKNPGDLCTALIYRLDEDRQLSVELTIEEIK